MENSLKKKFFNRKRRAVRNRFYLRGTGEKPRLSVVRSNMHIHVQLINDDEGVTLASTSTLDKELRGTPNGRKSKSSAKALGLKIAELARSKNVSKAVFDRGPFRFHGVIAEVAAGAREGGLEV